MNNIRPFDLGKLDFDARRKQKRKKLLLISLPLVVLALLVAAWLIVPTVLTAQSSAAFEKGNYAEAESKVSGLSFLNLIEPYKAFYNQGTALSAKGNREAAIEKFETALAYTNDQEAVCAITYNLVLTLEGSGDAAVVKKELDTVIAQYTRSLNTLKDKKECFEDESLQKRIEQKLTAAEEAKQRNGNDDQNGDDSSEEKSASTEQQEKLKKAEQNGSDSRGELRAKYYDYETLPKGVLPW